MTLFATILTLKGRGTPRINTWHPPAEFTPLSPFLLFRLINSTASFQNEPHTWLCMKSSKRLTASANSSIAKAGKGLNIQNLWCFLVFTEAQLCFFSILKSNMTQQVQYSSTGWFVLLDLPPTGLETRTRVMLAWKFYWQLFGPNTQNSTWATKESVQTK